MRQKFSQAFSRWRSSLRSDSAAFSASVARAWKCRARESRRRSVACRMRRRRRDARSSMARRASHSALSMPPFSGSRRGSGE